MNRNWNTPFLLMAISMLALLITGCRPERSGASNRATPQAPMQLTGAVRVGAPEELTALTERFANGWLTNIRLDGDVLFAIIKEGEQTRPIAINLLTKELAELDGSALKGDLWPTLPKYFDWIESPDGRSEKLYMYDLTTSKKIAIPGTSNNQRWPSLADHTIVWAEITGDNSWDIYAYDIATDQITTVVSRPGVQAYPKIEGNWIVYVEETSQDQENLYLHNLTTSKDSQLGTSMFASQCEGCTYGIGNGQLVWVGWIPTQSVQSAPSLYVYDLNTGATETIDTSLAACPPRGFTLAGDLMKWGCTHKQMAGYDLKQKVFFEFSAFPEAKLGRVESETTYLSPNWIVWLVVEREGNAVLPRTPGVSVPPPSSSEEVTPTKRKFRLFAAPITR